MNRISAVYRSGSRLFLFFCLFAATAAAPAQAQKLAKYGADFLSGGVGGRALAMGGAHVALTQDVSAGYWNAAGLNGLAYPQVAYMHAERFAGIVSFDYGSAAFPINARSTVGLSFFRSGVNDIKNTLDAWDAERDQPKPNPESYFKSFSAADYAFFLSYARAMSDRLAIGVTGKVIRRTIGPFADAWGYSFDVSAQYRTGRFLFGANLQDATRMLQSWTVNPEAFAIEGTNPSTGEGYTFQDVFEDELPQGGTFVVLPVARLGSGYVLPFGLNSLTFGFDMDLAFDGQKTHAFNAGALSFHPRLGTEFSYRGVVALRAGLGRITRSDVYGLDFSPTVGAGLQLKQFSVNYGFGDFAGLTSDLGFSHRISARLSLEQPGLQRKGR